MKLYFNKKEGAARFSQAGAGGFVILMLILLAPLASGADPTTSLRIGGAWINVTLPKETLPISKGTVLHWIVTAAEAVSDYYGRFPVRSVAIAVVAGNRGAVGHGIARGGRRI